MALTPEDIELHKQVLGICESVADRAARDFWEADERLRRAEQAVRSEKAILRAEGVDV